MCDSDTTRAPVAVPRVAHNEHYTVTLVTQNSGVGDEGRSNGGGVDELRGRAAMAASVACLDTPKLVVTLAPCAGVFPYTLLPPCPPPLLPSPQIKLLVVITLADTLITKHTRSTASRAHAHTYAHLPTPSTPCTSQGTMP